MIILEITLNSGDVSRLTPEEARDMYEQLGAIFDKSVRVSDVLNKYIQSPLTDPFHGMPPQIPNPMPRPNWSTIGPVCNEEVEPR